jgi:hypothetical protein
LQHEVDRGGGIKRDHRALRSARMISAARGLAPAGPRLASVLVEAAAKSGEPHEDFLAVVVRQRPDRRSEPVLATTR